MGLNPLLGDTFGINVHTPEFKADKRKPPLADPLLFKKYGPPVIQVDRRRDQQEQGRKAQQGESSQDKIQGSLEGLARDNCRERTHGKV